MRSVNGTSAAVQAGEVDPTARQALWLFLPERRLKTDAVPDSPIDLQVRRTKRRRTPPPARAGVMAPVVPTQAQLHAHAEITAQPLGEAEHQSVSEARKAWTGRGGLRVALKAMSRALRGKHKRQSLTS